METIIKVKKKKKGKSDEKKRKLDDIRRLLTCFESKERKRERRNVEFVNLEPYQVTFCEPPTTCAVDS